MALEFASKKETFPHYRKFETTLAGRPFVVETGKMCALSSGSCMVSYGERKAPRGHRLLPPQCRF